MNAALLQQKLYGAYAMAAEHLGSPCTLYRPDGTGDPIVPANALASLPASFNAEDMGYAKPRGYGEALWYCLADGTQLQVGDYLARGALTYFIAALQPLLPILAVQCNRRVRIGRMPTGSGAGYQGYAAVVQSAETDALGAGGIGSMAGSFASGWPAAILIGGGADRASLLPSGVRESGVTILLPASVPLEIVESDVIQDDLGRDFAIYNAEQSALGWRLFASEEHA